MRKVVYFFFFTRNKWKYRVNAHFVCSRLGFLFFFIGNFVIILLSKLAGRNQPAMVIAKPINRTNKTGLPLSHCRLKANQTRPNKHRSALTRSIMHLQLFHCGIITYRSRRRKRKRKRGGFGPSNRAWNVCGTMKLLLLLLCRLATAGWKTVKDSDTLLRCALLVHSRRWARRQSINMSLRCVKLTTIQSALIDTSHIT